MGRSLAYFIYDAICCELIKHELANLLHHVATIVGLTVGVFHKVVRLLLLLRACATPNETYQNSYSRL